ncbi:unnamed protein product [Natator depressus]
MWWIFALPNFFLKFSVSLPIIMAEKRKSGESGVSSSTKHRRNLNTKIEIIERSERGETPTEISRVLGIPQSTIASILQKKEWIQKRVKGSAPMQSTVITKQHVGLIAQVERLLIIWLEDQYERCAPVSSGRIQEKAGSLYDDLKKQLGESSDTEPFNANGEWLMRFKARANLHNMKVSDEAVSADEQAARVFPKTLLRSLKRVGIVLNKFLMLTKLGSFGKKCRREPTLPKRRNPCQGTKLLKIGSLFCSVQMLQVTLNLNLCLCTVWKTPGLCTGQ